MLDVIEKLLVLQDRDRKIHKLREEVARITPERESLQNKSAHTQNALDSAKLKGKQIESDRKKLELDVEARKLQIEKYSVQQFQTKKNEEFRAIGQEIEHCKSQIAGIEDQQLELMEQADVAQKAIVESTQAAAATKKSVDAELAQLAGREENLKKELAGYEGNRGQLAAAVDNSTLAKYERLLKHKGDNVVVGIDNGVCGGCHMKLPVQVFRQCQAHKEIVTCSNCGRILYHTSDMDYVESD